MLSQWKLSLTDLLSTIRSCRSSNFTKNSANRTSVRHFLSCQNVNLSRLERSRWLFGSCIHSRDFIMLLASINSATLPCKSSKQLSELYSQSNMFISYVNPWFHLAVYVTGLLWKHFKWLLLYFWAISRGLMVDQFIFVSGTKNCPR